MKNRKERPSMAKKRVYELATELGIESKTLMTQIRQLGGVVHSASSTVEPSVVRELRSRNNNSMSGRPGPEPTRGTPPATEMAVVERGRATTEPTSQVPNPFGTGARRPSGEPRPSQTSGSATSLPVVEGTPAFVLRDRASEAYIRRLEEAFPITALHRQAFRLLKSDYSWARPQPDGTWIALVKFGPAVANLFGFTREILAHYSPFPDLEPRLFKNLPYLLRQIPSKRSAEDHVFLVWTPDRLTRRKLDSWSPEGSFTAVALPTIGDARRMSGAFFETMHGRLASRNLYDESLPVTGGDFFGRRQLLAQLVDEIRQGNVCGIFGLRKTGKTSLLKEIGQRYQGLNVTDRIFLLRDLENLPSDPDQLLEAIVADLQSSFLAEFDRRGVKAVKLANLKPSASIGEFRRALEVSVQDCRSRGIQIVLALDEIESVVGDAKQISGDSRPVVPEFLGTLRSLVQENANFNVVLAGITSAAFELGYLYKRENPMFSWAKVFYLPPLSAMDITQLTKDVGARMAVHWTEDGLRAIYNESGGNVFLHRTLAAYIASRLASGPTAPRRVDAELVARSVRPWRRSVAQRLQEMLESTERHYPVECELLNAFVQDRTVFDELADGFPGEVHRLLSLGLIDETEDGDFRLGALSAHLVEAGLA